MIDLSLAEMAEVTGGRLLNGSDPAAVVSGPLVVDSRRVVTGGLFCCLVGEHADGHEFAAAAVGSGATGVLASRPVDVAGVLVPNVARAMADLAREVCSRLRTTGGLTVAGITGSSGKTTTKDLLATMFAAAGPTIAAYGSFNNELGLPLTVCEATRDTRWLVLEYSARGIGHIRELCRVVAPDLAAVLNVGHAHVGEFGDMETTALAKGELVEALPATGTAVLNADDPRVSAMSTRTAARVMTFGQTRTADLRWSELSIGADGCAKFRLDTPGGSSQVRLGVAGVHQVANAAAAVGIGLAAGLPMTGLVTALESARPRSPHRMDVRHRADGGLIIDDAYNANPESMLAALVALGDLAAGRRMWAVLGAMRELGPDSERLHAEIGARAAELGVAELIAVGPDAAAYLDGAQGVAGWAGTGHPVADADDARKLLQPSVTAGDVVLIKASNSERLWELAERLLDDSSELSAAGGA